jgi:ribosomal protein L16 Arg81 hydroxylase
MSTYLELQQFNYNEMTPKERDVILKDFKKPVVIRGLYQPVARQMELDKVIQLFGDSILPVEIYDTLESRSMDADVGQSTIKELFNHWKANKKPYLYCAEVDLFEQKLPILLEALRNPNTEPRDVKALMLFFGKNHPSDLHIHVTSDFILNQLFGTKTVYIFSNYDNPNINKYSAFDDIFNYSKEDFFKLDHSKMKIYKVTLQPGDSLLIPPWYWHATQGHGINMSITQIYTRIDISYLISNPNIIIDYLFSYPEFIIVPIVAILIIYISIRRRR